MDTPHMRRLCLDCMVRTTDKGRCDLCRRKRNTALGTKQQRGYDAEYTRNRALVLAGNPPCHYCPRPATTAGHIRSIKRGGGSNIENLQPECYPCNVGKSNRAKAGC